jgi:hypothetical protein
MDPRSSMEKKVILFYTIFCFVLHYQINVFIQHSKLEFGTIVIKNGIENWIEFSMDYNLELESRIEFLNRDYWS